MNLLRNIDFIDFYFNGHYLSEFGGIVGGTDPLKQYPLLPTRSYITDKATGQDGVYVFGSFLEPRAFEVPVFFENIDYAGLRNIAAWLNTPEDTWFYFKGDDLKIKCSVDGEYLLDSLSGENGQVYLKFIAHDPYYYQINEDIIVFDNLQTGEKDFLIENIGNQPCYPTFTFYSDVQVWILTEDKNTIISECLVNNIPSGSVVIDSYNCNCLTGAGANWFNQFWGEFPVLPTGKFCLRVSGNTQRIEIQPNFRWI